MEVLCGLTLERECITIDDKRFIDCIFIDCILEYSGGEISFEFTRMRGCRYVFYGKARRTLHFLQGVGLVQNRVGEWGEFSETLQ
jgi:hypothetical protein